MSVWHLFIHGAFLSEPRNLFEGTQKYKRYIRLKSYDDAPWDYLKQLIEEASQLAPRSLQAQNRNCIFRNNVL